MDIKRKRILICKMLFVLFILYGFGALISRAGGYRQAIITVADATLGRFIKGHSVDVWEDARNTPIGTIAMIETVRLHESDCDKKGGAVYYNEDTINKLREKYKGKAFFYNEILCYSTEDLPKGKIDQFFFDGTQHRPIFRSEGEITTEKIEEVLAIFGVSPAH